MEDIVYIKEGRGGILDDHPLLRLAIYIVLYFTIPFACVYFFVFIGFSPVAAAIVTLLAMFYILCRFMYVNRKKSVSDRTGFVKRGGKLYAVQVLLTMGELGIEIPRNAMDVSSEPALQVVGSENNFKIANDVQAHEENVGERAKKAQSFRNALDDILDNLKEWPEEYYVIPDSKRSWYDNLVKYGLENGGLTNIETEHGKYRFLILEDAKVIKSNKKTFTVRFSNENHEPCTVKFTNCYGSLPEDINRLAQVQ